MRLIHVALITILFTTLNPSLSTGGEPPDRPPPLTSDKPVDYVAWYNDFVRRGRDEKDNAYPIFLKLCPDEDRNGGFRPATGKAAEQFEKVGYRVWTTDEFPELATYLRSCEPSFRTLKEAAEQPAFWIPFPTNSLAMSDRDEPLFPIGPQCIKALIRQSWCKSDDPYRRLFETWEISLKSAALFARQPTIDSALASSSIRSVVREQVLDAVAAGVVSTPAQLQQTYGLLLTLDSEPHDWRPAFFVEWARLLDRLQRLTRDGKLDTPAWLKFIADTGYPPKWGETPPGVADTVRLIDEYYAELQEILGVRLASRRILRIDEFERNWADRLERNAFLRRALPALNAIHFTAVQRESEALGTRTALALHAYRATHGRWPESLQQIDDSLEGALADAQTIDPFNAKRFIYKLKKDEPWLYSVGWNLQDDEGRHDALFGKRTDADYRFWPRPK